MNWNTVDYMIMALIIISAISGFKQGFIKAIGSLVSMLAGLLLAYVYYGQCALYLEEYYGVSSALANVIRGKVAITVVSIDTSLAGIEFADTAQYLAYLIIMAASFIAIYLLSSRVLLILWSGLDHLFSWGILAAANKVLGMILIIFKTTVVLVITIGLVYPALEMASRMGIYFSLIAFQGLEQSVLSVYLLSCFGLLKDIISLKL